MKLPDQKCPRCNGKMKFHHLILRMFSPARRQNGLFAIFICKNNDFGNSCLPLYVKVQK